MIRRMGILLTVVLAVAARPRAALPAAFARVGADRATAFGKALAPAASAKTADIGDLLAAMRAAIDGVHPIATWQLEIAGRDDVVDLGKASASVHCSVRVQPQEKGFGMSFGAGASR